MAMKWSIVYRGTVAVMYILGLTLSYLQSKQHIQLNYHRIKTSLTKSFYWLLSASSVCRPDDVIGDVVRDDDNNPSPPPPPLPLLGLSAFTLFFMMLSHTGGKLYLPPFLLRLRFRDLIKMASFTPLSNHLDSVVRISVLSNSTGCSSCSVWICFATSEVVELGL